MDALQEREATVRYIRFMSENLLKKDDKRIQAVGHALKELALDIADGIQHQRGVK